MANDIRTGIRRRPVLFAGAALTTLLAVGTAFTWWTSPSMFGPPGNAVGQTQTTDELDNLHAAMTTVSVQSPTYRVRLDQARARIVTNTARAKISFSVCTARSPGFLSANGDLADHCARVEPIRDTVLTVNGEPEQYVVMTVRPTQVGVVRIDGMNLTYGLGWEHAWQHGTQATGMEVVVRVRRGGPLS